MPYDKLLKRRRIKPYRARPREVEQLPRVAAPDPTTAEKVLPDDLDWAFDIVYDAVLQASRALGPEHTRQVTLFEQMRRQRHGLVHEVVGLVSRQEAEQALAFEKQPSGREPLAAYRATSIGT